jgi:hypothetical protein
MNNAHPLSTPMILRSLDAKKNPFQPLEKGWRNSWSWSNIS